MATTDGGVELPQQQHEEVDHVEKPVTNDTPTNDDDNEIDDLFEDEDEIVPELISGDHHDFTKAYNRQRKLNDTNIPDDHKPKLNPQKPSANTNASIDDQVASLAKHAGKIRLTGRMTGASGGNARDKDKADRATTEQVLDRRTQMILLQLINRGVISEIHGVISTGKEANVYHAMTKPQKRTPTPSTVPSRCTRRPSSFSRTAQSTSKASSASGRDTTKATIAPWYGCGQTRSAEIWPGYTMQAFHHQWLMRCETTFLSWASSVTAKARQRPV